MGLYRQNSSSALQCASSCPWAFFFPRGMTYPGGWDKSSQENCWITEKAISGPLNLSMARPGQRVERPDTSSSSFLTAPVASLGDQRGPSEPHSQWVWVYVRLSS